MIEQSLKILELVGLIILFKHSLRFS